MTLPYPPPVMDLRTLAEHICTGESTIEHWVRTGLFPAPRKIGGKNLWRWKDVEKHLAPAPADGAASPLPTAEEITRATHAATTRQN
jgi:predicted DNA-binding transcriptional regulator AlpA